MHVAMDVLTGYLLKTHMKEGWRVPTWSAEDYVQEGLLQYLHIEHYYTSRCTEKPATSDAKGTKAKLHALLSTGFAFTFAELVAATGATPITVRTSLSDLRSQRYAGACGVLDIEHHTDGTYGVRGKAPPKRVTEPQHFMALFKTHWARHIHDQSKKETLWCSVVREGEEEEVSLANLEAAAMCGGVEEEEVLSRLQGDARALVTLFMTPGEVVTEATDGIVFTAKQARKIAARLKITAARVRNAAVTVLKELISMPTPIECLATRVGITPQAHEKREAYLLRLLYAAEQVDNATWDQWSGEELEKAVRESGAAAQLAHIKLVEARNANKPLVSADIEGAADTPKVLQRTRAANAGRAPRGAGIVSPTSRARELMTLNADMSPLECKTLLEEEKLAPPSMATLQAMRSDIRAVLRVLSDHRRLVTVATPTES